MLDSAPLSCPWHPKPLASPVAMGDEKALASVCGREGVCCGGVGGCEVGLMQTQRDSLDNYYCCLRGGGVEGSCDGRN